MRRRLLLGALVLVVGLAPDAAWAENRVDVVSAAASAGTNFGLRLTLQQNQTNQAYVMAGPDKGFNNESHLRGSFYIKPFGMDLPSTAGQSYFQMMDFLQGFGSNSNVKLIFFLQEDSNGDDLFLTAWHWNDHAAGGAGNWVFSGNGFFAKRSLPTVFAQNRIDYEWTAGDPGNLKAWRTNIDSGGNVGSTQLMFDVPLPGQANARINYVFAGYFAAKAAQTAGTCDFDEFVFNR
jgi:hypothetical protein